VGANRLVRKLIFACVLEAMNRDTRAVGTETNSNGALKEEQKKERGIINAKKNIPY